jgi:hypothetical protein
LTDFSRLLARHVSRSGLVDHKGNITKSSGREKAASAKLLGDGPNQPIIFVKQLARYLYRAALFALLYELI